MLLHLVGHCPVRHTVLSWICCSIDGCIPADHEAFIHGLRPRRYSERSHVLCLTLWLAVKLPLQFQILKHVMVLLLD